MVGMNRTKYYIIIGFCIYPLCHFINFNLIILILIFQYFIYFKHSTNTYHLYFLFYFLSYFISYYIFIIYFSFITLHIYIPLNRMSVQNIFALSNILCKRGETTDQRNQIPLILLNLFFYLFFLF